MSFAIPKEYSQNDMEKFIKEIKYERPMFGSLLKKSSFMTLYNDTEELKKFI